MDVHVTPEFESPDELYARVDRVLARAFDVHEEEEDDDDDDGDEEPSRFRGGFLPMRMCRQFRLGNCRYGWGCTFAHDVRELHPLADLRDV